MYSATRDSAIGFVSCPARQNGVADDSAQGSEPHPERSGFRTVNTILGEAAVTMTDEQNVCVAIKTC